MRTRQIALTTTSQILERFLPPLKRPVDVVVNAGIRLGVYRLEKDRATNAVRLILTSPGEQSGLK